MPLTPHCNTRFFHGQCSERFWYDGTMELLRRCDGIVMIPGWEKSTGARAEEQEARRLGLARFYWPEEKDQTRRAVDIFNGM